MTKSGLADSPLAQLMYKDVQRMTSPTPLYEAPKPPHEVVPKLNNIQSEAKNERMNVPPNEQTNEIPLSQEAEAKPPRQIIRHTFDIFQDQLVRLQFLQVETMRQGKRKPKLGKMVQQALEQYLTQQEKKQSPKQG